MGRSVNGPPLLGPSDPPPVEVLNAASGYPIALTCEHAGRTVPVRLNGLGLDGEQLSQHIGWDIGAGALTRRLAARLDAPAVLQQYSRLVIDCNRSPETPDSVVEVSDGVRVPGNIGISMHAREQRIDEIFAPFERAVGDLLGRDHCRAAISIHSFTPTFDGVMRPLHVGFLYRVDEATSRHLASTLAALRRDLIIGHNEPYQVDDLTDRFVPHHCEPRGLAHSLVEIRNDELAHDAGIDHWVELLSGAIGNFAREVRQ